MLTVLGSLLLPVIAVTDLRGEVQQRQSHSGSNLCQMLRFLHYRCCFRVAAAERRERCVANGLTCASRCVILLVLPQIHH